MRWEIRTIPAGPKQNRDVKALARKGYKVYASMPNGDVNMRRRFKKTAGSSTTRKSK